MKPVFLSFLLAKLKQIHIDKSKTTGYSTDIPQCFCPRHLSTCPTSTVATNNAAPVIDLSHLTSMREATQSNNTSSKAIAPSQLTSSPSPSLLLQPAPDPILRRHTRPFSDQPYPNWPNRLSATSTVMATRRVRMGDGGSDSVGVSISIRGTWRSSRVFRGRVWWIPQLRKWVLQKTIPELE